MKYKLSNYVHFILIKNSYWAIINSINQELFFCKAGFKRKVEKIYKFDNNKLQKNFNDDIKIIKYIKKAKFIIPVNINEKNRNNFRYKLTGKRNYTLLRILLTDLCNLNCAYCKVKKNIKSSIHTAIPDEKLSLITKEFFSNSSANHPKIIHITGGEPLIFWNKIIKIIELINNYKRRNEKYTIIIGTNSLLLDSSKIDFIKNNNIKLIISLDGKKEHNDRLRRDLLNRGTFKLIDQKLRALKNRNVNFGLSMVVGKHNYKNLNEIISFFLKEYAPQSLGVNFMKAPTKNEAKFSYLIKPHDYALRIYKIFRKYRKKGLFMELVYRKLKPFVYQQFRFHDCGAANGTTINIDSKGRVGPCKSFLIMKKISTDKINSKAIDNIVNKFKKRSPIFFQECRKCPSIAICGNGCAYSALIESGDYMAIDRKACEYTRSFHHQIISDLFKLLHNEVIKNSYFVVNKNHRKKLLGQITIDHFGLASSIGHET